MKSETDCIFCKIVAGLIPCSKIWENENYMAFLDIYPLRKAQTVVIPKAHLPSSIFALPDDVYVGLMDAAKKTSLLLEDKLGAERTMVVGEGLEIAHAHLKLYPRFSGEHGLVHAGGQADFDELKELHGQITG